MKEKKLKLIQHNKKAQKSLGININNYILFKRKYVVIDKNGIAKEYGIYDDKLIYEGEYLNGERNRIGKEYNNDRRIIFDGEYKKGKRWNGLIQGFRLKDGQRLVKEYINSKFGLNDVIFLGEYLNVERNVNGNEYNIYGELIFKGEYLNGKKYNGIVYDNFHNKTYKLKNGKCDLKEFKNNILFKNKYFKYFDYDKTGKEKEYNDFRKLIFEGDYLYGAKIKGKGYRGNELIFEGEYINDKKWKGNGKEYNDNGELIFEGEYLYGLRLKGKEYMKEN